MHVLANLGGTAMFVRKTIAWRLVLVLVLIGLGVASATFSFAASSVRRKTPAGHLKIWHVNLQDLGANWQRFVNVTMASSYHKPDIITVTGVGINKFEEEFWPVFNPAYNHNYDYVHGDDDGAADGNQSNVAIIYDHEQLGTANNDPEDVRRWSLSGTVDCGVAGSKKRQIAARFALDGDSDTKALIVAALHFPKHELAKPAQGTEPAQPESGVSQACMDDSLQKADQKIADLAEGDPDLTDERYVAVIGGDLNKHPADDPDMTPNDNLTKPQCGSDTDCIAGYETNPECWYAYFSAGINKGSPTTCGTKADHLPANRYFDTVAEQVAVPFTGPDPLGQVDDPEIPICQQWTHGRDSGVPEKGAYEALGASSSCTDALSEEGLALTLFGGVTVGVVDTDTRDKSRLDYIWVRWGGEPQEVTSSVAATRIQEATADLAAFNPGDGGSGATGSTLATTQRYSDHRAVTATFIYPK